MCTSIKQLTLILIALSLLWACSDSSTGPSADEPPEPPSFERIEMDLDIFDNAFFNKSEFPQDIEKLRSMMQNGEATPMNQDQSPYEAAAFFAFYADLLFQSMSIYPTVFFDINVWGDARVEGDTWVWEFSQSFEGESFTMRVTAETTSTNRIWELRYSYSGSEGPDVENALFMRAEISLNGNIGEWAIYDLFEGQQSTAIVTFDYVIEDDITTMLEMNIPDGDERLLYEVDGQIATLTGFESGSVITTIQWNRDTGSGWIQSDDYNNGAQTCWDENFQTTSC
ncbi:MAG: hypothetical protein LAT84_03660 [Balneolia bacterium]|nr:hypothetical protein [Balneolia bacterium]